MDTGRQNEEWAYRLIDALIAQGVEYFCCAPGSRSTPLLLAVSNHPKADFTVHFDERGLCFHAVGYAKGSGKPAAVIATSGTAVANLLPGIIEACNDHVPLIILSADRPPELRDCGANQTCDQVKMFTNYVRYQVDLPCPDARISEQYLASTVSHAVAMAKYPLQGPVQINCCFREPLFSEAVEPREIAHHVAFEAPVLHPSDEAVAYWKDILTENRRGVIIVGSDRADHSEAIFALAERLQWPIFADVLTSLRGPGKSHALISHFDPILKLKGSEKVDAVIQFGDRFASKTLSTWLEKQSPGFFLHVSDHVLRQDPIHRVTHRVQSCPNLFVEKLLAGFEQEEDADWLNQWKKWDENCHRGLSEFFAGQSDLSEPGLIWEIGAMLPEGWSLFPGTSMPIRDANQFFNPASNIAVFGNRGVSGIDGIVATACGIAKGSKRPLLAVVGDLTLLHDLNSLAMLSHSKHPVVLCVVNNGGGGIFSFLPVAKRKEAFEEFIAASHETTFASAAALFSLPYFQLQTPGELREHLLGQGEHPRSVLFEITTDRAENVKIHEQILHHIATCLDATAEIPAILH